MNTNEKILKLVEDTFTESDIRNIAMYIISSLAVGEATHSGIMGGRSDIEGVPPQAVETMYLYDSGLTDNEFFLKHFVTLKAAIITDRIRLAAITEVVRAAQSNNEVPLWRSVRGMIMSKMDSLSLLAFLWKGYEFSIDFTCKLRAIYQLAPEMEEFFERNING